MSPGILRSVQDWVNPIVLIPFPMDPTGLIPWEGEFGSGRSLWINRKTWRAAREGEKGNVLRITTRVTGSWVQPQFQVLKN